MAACMVIGLRSSSEIRLSLEEVVYPRIHRSTMRAFSVNGRETHPNVRQCKRNLVTMVLEALSSCQPRNKSVARGHHEVMLSLCHA